MFGSIEIIGCVLTQIIKKKNFEENSHQFYVWFRRREELTEEMRKRNEYL